MKTSYKIQALFLALFLLSSNHLFAQTIETNVPGLVIKDYRCNSLSIGNWVEGNLINRNGIAFNGALRVKIIDKENDILWQGIQKLMVDAQNGSKFSVKVLVGNCLAPNVVQITLER